MRLIVTIEAVGNGCGGGHRKDLLEDDGGKWWVVERRYDNYPEWKGWTWDAGLKKYVIEVARYEADEETLRKEIEKLEYHLKFWWPDEYASSLSPNFNIRIVVREIEELEDYIERNQLT